MLSLQLPSRDLPSPLVRLLDTDPHTAVNSHRDGRMSIDYGVFAEQDALTGREASRHGARLGHEPMSLPVGAVSSRT